MLVSIFHGTAGFSSNPRGKPWEIAAASASKLDTASVLHPNYRTK